LNKHIYRGTVICHELWYDISWNKGTRKLADVHKVEMSPGLAGTYIFKGNARHSGKVYLYRGTFDKAVISNNQITFYWSGHPANKPLLVVDFDPGEVNRLLSEDRWFQDQSWFKVVIEDIQLSIF